MTKQQKEAMDQLNNLKTFGVQIREGRDKCGYSKSRLAEELTDRRHTVTEKDIARWERESRYPDIDLIYKLAEKLKLDPNEMLHAKQVMQEAGLNLVDMISIRTVCKILDGSIWFFYYANRIFIISVLAIAIIRIMINYVQQSTGGMM